MRYEFNLAGNVYGFEWNDGMQSWLVIRPDESFVKVGYTMDVAFTNMWDYIELPDCFTGNIELAHRNIEIKIHQYFIQFDESEIGGLTI